MKQAYIHHHLGMGDHIMCNALVRHFAKEYDVLFLFTKTRYIPEIRYMYRDLRNIRLLGIMDEEWSAQFKVVESHRMLNPLAHYIKVGHDYLYNTDLPADQAFYKQVGLDWNERYDGFHIERDLEAEQEVYDYYNPEDEPYVFVHQDTNRRELTLDKSFIKRKDLKVIEINHKMHDKKPFNFFHHMKLMENATESHYVDSAFKCLADSFLSGKEEMYFHRIQLIKNTTTCQDHWHVIDHYDVKI